MVTPRIGCSGWNYAAWRGHFYPADLPASQWLERYASSFDTVEVNNTFYRLPEASTFAAWRCQTPSRFLMAVKAPLAFVALVEPARLRLVALGPA